MRLAPGRVGTGVARVKVSRFSRSGRHCAFRFMQTDDLPDLIAGCRQFDVQLVDAKANRKEAVMLLMQAHRHGRELELGYMGRGLLRVGQSCLFLNAAPPIKSHEQNLHLPLEQCCPYTSSK